MTQLLPATAQDNKWLLFAAMALMLFTYKDPQGEPVITVEGKAQINFSALSGFLESNSVALAALLFAGVLEDAG